MKSIFMGFKFYFAWVGSFMNALLNWVHLVSGDLFTVELKHIGKKFIGIRCFIYEYIFKAIL